MGFWGVSAPSSPSTWPAACGRVRGWFRAGVWGFGGFRPQALLLRGQPPAAECVAGSGAGVWGFGGFRPQALLLRGQPPAAECVACLRAGVWGFGGFRPQAARSRSWSPYSPLSATTLKPYTCVLLWLRAWPAGRPPGVLLKESARSFPALGLWGRGECGAGQGGRARPVAKHPQVHEPPLRSNSGSSRVRGPGLYQLSSPCHPGRLELTPAGLISPLQWAPCA